jgi:hypothetical protein
VVSFIGGGNRSTQRKPPTCLKSLTNLITLYCTEYTWSPEQKRNFGYILIRIVGVLAPINFKILFWLWAYLIQRLLKKHIVYTQLDIKVLITLKTYNKYWVSDCRLTPYEHSYIMTRTSYIQWKDDDVLASLDLYSASSMEQTVCR